MSANAHIEGLNVVAARPTLDAATICRQIARKFQVRLHEVALLRVEGSFLRFTFPPELSWAGTVPLSSSALAARTARNRRAELSNVFALEPHWRLFERVHLRCAGGKPPRAIQKILSVPAIGSSNEVTGVIQVSRKADTHDQAGPDFQTADLVSLQQIAAEIADLLPLLPTSEADYCW